MTDPRVNQTLERFERITNQLDSRDGAARDAARRERQRLNRSLGQALARIAVAVGVISLVTIIIGLIVPIGMFGFLAAVGLAIGVAALIGFGSQPAATLPQVEEDVSNAQMVAQFDSYVFRARKALPKPAQAEMDRISSMIGGLKQTLERVPTLDPAAQDARRLMSRHIPGLVDRYLNVPQAYRGETDGEGKTVDQRLVEALAAGRQALDDIGENLAKQDLLAFETQGRFIQSRYNDQTIDS
ncbi:hypothetical protein [Sphingomonas jaspsi]|uniref:hypothetical protein n=1 Tax=Sphingomonas jaspsi TaxID=392409 RepID=UPI0004BC5C0F|nr:hypothetical protein [Sphingomonas jaspsi]